MEPVFCIDVVGGRNATLERWSPELRRYHPEAISCRFEWDNQNRLIHLTEFDCSFPTYCNKFRYKNAVSNLHLPKFSSSYCDGVRSACLGAGRVCGKGDGQEATKEEAVIGDQMRVWKASWGVFLVARSLFAWLFCLSAEKYNNRKFFSCIWSIILEQLQTIFLPSVPRSLPPRFSLLVLARLRSWP